MGLFGKTNEVAKAIEIYEKAQKGELQALLTIKGEVPQFSMIQLVKNNNDCYMLVVKDKVGKEILNLKLS